MRYRQPKHKKSIAPFVLMILGAIVLIFAFVPAKVLMIILAFFLIVVGLCMCFG